MHLVNLETYFFGHPYVCTFWCVYVSFEHRRRRGRRQCFVLICRRSARKESENRGRGYSCLEETETKPPPTTTGSPDLSYREPLLKRNIKMEKILNTDFDADTSDAPTHRCAGKGKSTV